MSEARVALRPELSERLLEELIYERVRAHVDLLELGWFEADLDLSIRRVLAELDRARQMVPSDGVPRDAAADASGGADAPSAVLASTLIDRAWTRVEAEWQARRSGDDDDECPICLRSPLDDALARDPSAAVVASPPAPSAAPSTAGAIAATAASAAAAADDARGARARARRAVAR